MPFLHIDTLICVHSTSCVLTGQTEAAAVVTAPCVDTEALSSDEVEKVPWQGRIPLDMSATERSKSKRYERAVYASQCFSLSYYRFCRRLTNKTVVKLRW